MHTRKALTNLDMLVLIFLIILAVALLLPAIGRSKGGGDTRCATNLSGIGKALNIYASQYDDHLPIFSTPSNAQWLCDESPQFASTLLNLNATSPTPLKMLYCPSNASQHPEIMSNWNNTSVWGYLILNDRGSDAKNMPQDPPTRAPPETEPADRSGRSLYYASKLNSRYFAETTLAADWIVSSTTNPAANTGNPNIKRPGPPNLTFNSSHTVQRNAAAGGNVLTLDSSVHWRTFSPATATPIKQPGPVPVYFWIPANQ